MPLQNPQIWLRAETKPQEGRTPLVPKDAWRLVQAGFGVAVERSFLRVFADSDYAASGCEMVSPGSWRGAPPMSFILGLKELPEDSTPLTHRHIYFAHAYKMQAGWQRLLGRFVKGGGELLDLEYLVNEEGRRVAAFGYWAGFIGSAVGIDLWCHREGKGSGLPYGPLTPFRNVRAMAEGLRTRLEEVGAKRLPSILVIGALGRCGRGAVALAQQLGLSVTDWDLAETARGGPFAEILNEDILVNAVLVQQPVPPFLTPQLVNGPRRLSVIADVSCDPYSPFNPLPLYKQTTTFESPALRIAEGDPPLDLIAIDHLPALLPRESSEDFSTSLLPHLLDLGSGSSVWERARGIFREKTFELKKEVGE